MSASVITIGNPGLSFATGVAPAPPPALADYRVDAGIEGPGGVNLDSTKSEYLSRAITSSLQCVGTSFFYAGWVRSNAFDNGDYIISLSAAATTSIFDISYSAGVVTAQIFAGSSAGTNRTVTIGSSTADERWWFIVMWLDIGAGTFNLQINNGTVSSASTSTTIATAAAPLQFGARSGANLLSGQMISWCFGKAVPDSTERTWLYNSHSARVFSEVASGSPSLAAKLTSWWNLDETSGTRNDSVGTNHLTPQFASGTGPVKMVAMTQQLDQSGNANHITHPTDMNQRPLWFGNQVNGQGVIQDTRRAVDGIGSYGTSPNMALSTRKSLTVICVVKTAPGATGYLPFSNWNGSSGIEMQVPPTGTRTDEVVNAGGVAGVLTVPAVDTYRTLGMQFGSLAANGLSCWQNGSSGSSRSHATSTFGGADIFQLGRETSSGSYRSGTRGDMVIYGDQITPLQMRQRMVAMDAKFGFANGLPDAPVSLRWAGSNYTPGVVRTSTDHLIVFDRFNTATNRIQACRSRDFGRTWGEPYEVAAPTSTTTALTNSGTCLLSDNSILLTIGVTPTVGTARVEVWRSTDHGFTFSLWATISSAGGHSSVYPYGRIISVTISGTPTLLMPVYGITSAVSDSLLMQSTDNGATWTLRGTIAADTGSLHFNETAIIQVSGANLLAIIRDESPAAEVGDLYQATSADYGSTWSAKVYKFDGVAPLLINSLVSGVLLFRTYREGATVGSKGIFAHRTTDGGTNWGSGVQLWRNPGGTAFTGYFDGVPVSSTEYGGAYRAEGATATWTRFADSLIP